MSLNFSQFSDGDDYSYDDSYSYPDYNYTDDYGTGNGGDSYYDDYSAVTETSKICYIII